MKLSSKAKSLLMRAYTSERPIATFDINVENELLRNRLMRMEPKPMLSLTKEGRFWCYNHSLNGAKNG